MSLALGTELSLTVGGKGVASLRFGWGFQQDETGLSGSERLRGLSAGGGYSYRLYKLNIRADYAYRNLGLLSANHTYSLSFGF